MLPTVVHSFAELATSYRQSWSFPNFADRVTIFHMYVSYSFQSLQLLPTKYRHKRPSVNQALVTNKILLLSEVKKLSVIESDDVINQTTQNIFIESTLEIIHL